MSLLAPLFLLGALAVAAPVIAHLVRRATRERVLFSATKFLEPSPPRLDRRNRIEHPWLLLLRCLVVLVLAAGFARPFFRDTPPDTNNATAVRHTVVVLDASASMQRGDLWPEAVARTRAVASRLGEADRFALIAAGRAATVVLDSRAWSAATPPDRPSLLEAALADRTPGWEATHLDTAIEAALEELVAMSDTGSAAREATIVVISDFADGARISGLAGRDWPEGARLALEALPQAGRSNASLHALGWSTGPDGARQVRLRLAHDRDASAAYRVQLLAADDDRPIGEPVTLTLAPRETRAAIFPVPAGLDVPVRATLAGDEGPFDNTVWLVPPVSHSLALPYLGPGDATDPRQSLFYVARATTGWRDPAMTPQPLAPATGDLPEAPLYVVAASLEAPAREALRARLEAGASALVLARDAPVLATAAGLAGESGWTAGQPAARDDVMFADITFSHPLFAPFADPRFSDFTRMRFWEHTAIGLPAETRATVVARFDDGSPAVLEVPVGRGALVVWAGDWTPASSQWVLSTKFVPWFQALARRAAGGPPPVAMAEVGDTAILGALPAAEVPRTPGIFQVGDAGTRRTIALNVPAAESRTTPIPLDAWEQLGAPLASLERTAPDAARAAAERAALRAGSLAAAQLEADQKLWRWLLVTAAALLATESLVAIRAVMRRSPAPAA